MIFTETPIKCLFVIDIEKKGDDRGFFARAFCEKEFGAHGLQTHFSQLNNSLSAIKGTLRGMHYQPGQAKLVRCVRGAIFDVLVDIRPGSPQFGQWESFVLDDAEHRQLYCPDGFAHGFCVLSGIADVTYKVSSYYDPQAESGFAFDDPEVGVEWPADVDLISSERDRSAPSLAERRSSLPYTFAGTMSDANA